MKQPLKMIKEKKPPTDKEGPEEERKPWLITHQNPELQESLQNEPSFKDFVTLREL